MADDIDIINEPEEDEFDLDLYFNTPEIEESGDDDRVKQLETKLEQSQQMIAKLIEEQNKKLETVVNPPEQKKDEPEVVFPEKPANYDPVDAYTDPMSESFKYRIEYEKTQQELQRIEDLKKIAEFVDNRIGLVQQANKIKEMEDNLVKTRNVPENELNEFRNWLTQKKDISMEDMFDIYMKHKQPGKQKSQSNRQQNFNLNIPTATDFPGTPNEPVDEQLEFEKGIISGLAATAKKY